MARKEKGINVTTFIDNYALENNIEKINVTNIIPTGFEYMDKTGTLHFVSFKKNKKTKYFLHEI